MYLYFLDLFVSCGSFRLIFWFCGFVVDLWLILAFGFDPKNMISRVSRAILVRAPTLLVLVGILSNIAVGQKGCILSHCLPGIIKCEEHSKCSKQLNCLTPCSKLTNVDDVNRCNLRCMLMYPDGNQVFNDLMSCAWAHNCVPPGDHNCSTVTNTSQLFDLNTDVVDGSWFNTKGLNKGTDNFNCSTSTFNSTLFTPESRKTIWTLSFKMDDLGMRDIQGVLTVGGENHPGTAVFEYAFAGAHFKEFYQMVYFQNQPGTYETLVFVGCGGANGGGLGVGYNIGVVLSRAPYPLEHFLVHDIDSALENAQLKPLPNRIWVEDWFSLKFGVNGRCPVAEHNAELFNY